MQSVPCPSLPCTSYSLSLHSSSNFHFSLTPPFEVSILPILISVFTDSFACFTNSVSFVHFPSSLSYALLSGVQNSGYECTATTSVLLPSIAPPAAVYCFSYSFYSFYTHSFLLPLFLLGNANCTPFPFLEVLALSFYGNLYFLRQVSLFR